VIASALPAYLNEVENAFDSADEASSNCDFNVQFTNDVDLTKDQVKFIQQRINQVFSQVKGPQGGTLGVNFRFSGQADASLSVTNAGWITNFLLGSPMGVQGGAWGAPKVYWNNLPSGFSGKETATMAGSVGSHELAHVWLGGDLPYNASDVNLMMYDTAPLGAQVDALLNPNSSLWRMTRGQVGTLLTDCREAHPRR
jgi:hypothetical protein